MNIQRYGFIIFILIVFAITIPLTILIRAKIDMDNASEVPVPAPMVQEPEPVEEGGLIIETPDEPMPESIREVVSPIPLDAAPKDASPEELEQLASDVCEQAGGHWNPCGSACRNLPPETACIMVCVPQCECGGSDGWTCPEGTACADYEPLPLTPTSTGVCRSIAE